MNRERQDREFELRTVCKLKNEVESELDDTKEEVRRLEAALAAVHASWSWRVTWLLREPLQFLIWLYHISKYVVYSLVIKSAKFVMERPGLTVRVSALLDHFPGFRLRLNSVLSAAGWDPNDTNGHHPRGLRKEWQVAGAQALESAHDVRTLSETARKVYWDLKRTAGNRNKEED